MDPESPTGFSSEFGPHWSVDQILFQERSIDPVCGASVAAAPKQRVLDVSCKIATYK